MKFFRYVYISITLAAFVFLFSFTAVGLPSKILIEDFSSGILSTPWVIREFFGKADSGVIKDNGNFVLRLRSKNACSLVYREYSSLNLNDFKKLEWKWKVTKLPMNGDIRKRAKDDQAAQMYVRFPIIENPMKNMTFGAIWDTVMSNDLNAHMLGYVWDTKAPIGCHGTNKKWSSIRYMVLESGIAKLNRWIPESRNISTDYKKLFGRTPPSYIEGIGMMIDSDNTNASAESFFDDLVFRKE